jgi:hypothetical protein
MGASKGKVEGRRKNGGGQIDGINQIKWVRLVRSRELTIGIGFRRTVLVLFFQMNRNKGAFQNISIKESLLILRDMAEFELNASPDVESNSLAWCRWLRLIATGL